MSETMTDPSRINSTISDPPPRMAQMRPESPSKGWTTTTRGWQEDGLKWCGIGFCLMAGAIALHGLIAGSGFYAERKHTWQ